MGVPSRKSLPGQAGMEKLEEMIRTYRPPAMALALNILGNREDAEDACQEMFVSAFHELDSLPFPAGVKKWLFTILYRKCLDSLRRRRRSVRLAGRIITEDPDRLFHCDDAEGNPDRSRPRFLSKDLLAVLSDKEKAALSLWANEDYSPDEIAQVMGCSASTIRVHLFRARRKIKDKLEKGHDLLQAR
jgi:RNA polymerase sigma-70 factor (ECF subfamily)